MNGKANLPAMLLIAVGALLVWAGLTDRNPLTSLKAVLSGGKLPAAGSASASTGTPKVGPGSTGPNPGPFATSPYADPFAQGNGGSPFTLGYQTPQGSTSV